MADTPLSNSDDSTTITSSDKENIVSVEIGMQDTTVSMALVASASSLPPCPKAPEDTPKTSISTLESERAESSSNDPSAASFEHNIISAELEAQFDGLFITTPPISPNTKPLPYAQRIKSPKFLFPARKYTLPSLVGDSHQSTDDASNLSDLFREVSLHQNVPDLGRELDIEVALARLTMRFRTSGSILKPNPFPEVNMNIGWNRARYALDDTVYDTDASDLATPEEKKRICQEFKGYSLWAQIKPIELDEKQFGRIFEKVFVGRGIMGREPGTWWATRKPIFGEWRGKPFLKQVMIRFLTIGENVTEWKKSSLKTKTNNLKWKAPHSIETEEEGQVVRRLKTSERVSQRVMSDEWRARRRSQEKKAGRWTDGTLRMDRMWDEFHWVLNNDDPLDAVWDKKSELQGVQRGRVSDICDTGESDTTNTVR
jgi:hypothetical protein